MSKQTVDQYLAAAPAEIRTLLSNTLEEERSYRNRLLKALKANERCAFEDNQLDGLSTSMLERLADSYDIQDFGAGAIGPDGIVDNRNAIPAPPRCITAPVAR